MLLRFFFEKLKKPTKANIVRQLKSEKKTSHLIIEAIYTAAVDSLIPLTTFNLKFQ